MTESAQIQILMPVRNGARFLPATLDSLAAQTFTDFRLLVCDDGSTDDTPAILANESRFQVSVIRNRQQPGIVSALNQLLEAGVASGSPFLARLDADDLCHPDRFQRQCAFMQSHPEVGIVGSALRIIDSQGRPGDRFGYPDNDEAIRFTLLFEDALAHPALLMRTAVFEQPGRHYDAAFEFAEDYELWCRLAGKVGFANLTDELLLYRKHDHAVSVTRQREQAAGALRVRQHYLQRLGLSTEEHNAVAKLLGIDGNASPHPWSVREACTACTALRRLFPRTLRSAVGARRITDLTAVVFVGLNRWQRAAWMLRDVSVAASYLRAKFKRASAS